MAKKIVDLPVYPDSPLVIGREKFCSLLKDQIAKGEELLHAAIPTVQQPTQYYGYGHGDSTPYDEDAANAFLNSYKRWKDRNLAIYRTSFEAQESIYYHEYETQIWRIWGTDSIKECKENIQRQMNHMQGDLERVDLFKCAVADNAGSERPKENKERPFKVFISHSSKDREFVEHLVDLLEVIGIDGKDRLFCSSIPLYGIDLSANIYHSLLEQFQSFRLFIVFVHSKNYYSSPISLNEMGAAWVLRTEHCSILTAGFSYEEMKGVVKGDEISIKVDDSQAPHRLNQLKDKLTLLFRLEEIPSDKWEWKRDKFLERINR